MIQVNVRGMLAITPTITAITPKNKAKRFKNNSCPKLSILQLVFLAGKSKVDDTEQATVLSCKSGGPL